MTKYKNYNISFKTATPAMISGIEAYSDIRDDDAIQDYITAENETQAIEYALEYLQNTINPDYECKIDETAQEITYYDAQGNIIEQDYDFHAVEAAI